MIDSTMQYRSLRILTILILVASCHYSAVDQSPIASDRTSGVMINSRLAPVYADLSLYNINPQSKSQAPVGDSHWFLLDDIIDKNREEIRNFQCYTISAIPFNSDFTSGSVRLSDTLSLDYNLSTLTSTHIFLVRRFYQNTGMNDICIQTFIPDSDYVNTDSFSFFDPDFSGMILFSDLDGILTDALLVPALSSISPEVPVLPSEEELNTADIFLQIGLQGSASRETLNGGILQEAVVVAFREDGERHNNEDDTANRFNRRWENLIGGGANSSMNGALDYIQFGVGKIDKEDDKDCKSENCKVTLLATEHGVVKGSGVYRYGKTISIEAYGKQRTNNEKLSFILLPYVFERWTGDLVDHKEPIFQYEVIQDIEATAYFRDPTDSTHWPCYDGERFNPLFSMNVCPTQSFTWTHSYIGGTYGWVRTKRLPNGDIVPKWHDGIDFAATRGTPVYAMYDGIVVKAIGTQPDRILSDDGSERWVYPDTYTGTDRSAYGNRIVLLCTINNRYYQLLYAHLNPNGIAQQPGTNTPLSIGTQVHKGDLIGYTGVTGNAAGGNPHLHFGVYDVTSWGENERQTTPCYNKDMSINPINIINGEFDTNYQANGKIVGIICN